MNISLPPPPLLECQSSTRQVVRDSTKTGAVLTTTGRIHDCGSADDAETRGSVPERTLPNLASQHNLTHRNACIRIDSFTYFVSIHLSSAGRTPSAGRRLPPPTTLVG
eukprot:GHVU01012953.1.p1 GENE.GHVU01012953.1~~GHVU01012953.1.p1  ORF type:complete len:108 (-),score=3.78 GHVU01012953.1:638-961(-)